jgi:hypothetical protein
LLLRLQNSEILFVDMYGEEKSRTALGLLDKTGAKINNDAISLKIMVNNLSTAQGGTAVTGGSKLNSTILRSFDRNSNLVLFATVEASGKDTLSTLE